MCDKSYAMLVETNQGNTLLCCTLASEQSAVNIPHYRLRGQAVAQGTLARERESLANCLTMPF
jgi:hypothetical protein